MAYPNLAAEMTRNGITEKDIAIEIGRSPDTVRNWLKGKGDIPIGKALIIRTIFFPELSFEYLYATKPARPEQATEVL